MSRWDKKEDKSPIIISGTRDKFIFYFLFLGGLLWYTNITFKMIFGYGLI